MAASRGETAYPVDVAIVIRDGVPLAPLTTLELGGPARHFVDAADDDDDRRGAALGRRRAGCPCRSWAAVRTWSSPTPAATVWSSGSPRAGVRFETSGRRRHGDGGGRRAVGRAGRRGRRARPGGPRVPVRDPGPGRRDADPERRRLRAGGRRHDPLRAGARARELADVPSLHPRSAGSATATARSSASPIATWSWR